MSVYKAAMLYNIPESTLRDRTRGLVALDARNGTGTLFTHAEEEKLVGHIKYMADIGYGYNKSGIQYMAKDYAQSLGKDVKPSSDSLSNCWFYGLMGRWPDLKIVKPQKLAISRAKSSSREVISKYYQELGTILTTNNLTNKPNRIYNIDETGISTEHTPPRIVCDKNTNPQAVTSPRSALTTVIAAGNALGNSIPPYYVFPGARWNDELLSGASVGAAGRMSKKGWSSSDVFRKYLSEHFAPFANVGSGTDPTLILYDGHRSHISLTLTDWAKANNAILFVLPPHTSHLTQPLDVGIFGPFKAMYNKECQAYMKNNPGITITKYQVAELTARPYMKALTPENLTSAFKKTGIHPFNSSVITDSQVAPAVIYPEEQEETPADPNPQEALADTSPQESREDPNSDRHDERLGDLNEESCEPATPSETTIAPVAPATFFQERTIVKVVTNRRKRKFVPPVLTGNLMKKSVMDELVKSADRKNEKSSKLVMKSAEKGQQKLTKTVTKKNHDAKSGESAKKPKKSKQAKSKTMKTEQIVVDDQMPSTSGLNKQGGPIDLFSNEDSEYMSDIEDDDNVPCCVCNGVQPPPVRQCHSLIISKWVKCDFCPHWTHLIYCTDVRVIRRGDEFRCPHCTAPC